MELVKLKGIIDQLSYVFHKISANPRSGELYANPVEWGQRFDISILSLKMMAF